MDFGKTTLFVVPAGNSLPTTGSTDALTASQFGIFRPDYSVASAANIGAAQYIYLFQGRPQVLPILGTKRSNKIYRDKVIETYKITGSATANVQITHVTGFAAQCGETVSLSLRLFSTYINTGFYNGLTRTVTIQTPCCDCGSDPCTDVDVEALVDSFVTAINIEPRLSHFVTASKTGSGSGATLVITGNALDVYGNRCDPHAFPFEYDRMYFRTYAYRGPETTQDYNVFDTCDLFATATVTQKSTYATGLPAEITQLEKNWLSYQNPLQSTLFSNTNFNNAYTTEVSTGVTAYTTLYIRYYDPMNNAFTDVSDQESWAIIAAPPTEAAAILTRLELYFGTGAFLDKTSTN